MGALGIFDNAFYKGKTSKWFKFDIDGNKDENL